MCSLHDIPELVLHEIISQVIDLTSSDGWRFSLRLVNHQFNEALLHVYFLQKRLVPESKCHSLDCVEPCEHLLCQASRVRKQRDTYLARLTLRSLLAIRVLPQEPLHAQQLLDRWRAALTILQRHKDLIVLTHDRLDFYSICSDSPTFNDVYGAILAEALRSYTGLDFLGMLFDCDRTPRCRIAYHDQPVEFWVALSVCVIGNLSLFEPYVNMLVLPDQEPMPTGGPSAPVAYQFSTLLTVAVEHSRLDIVRFLLQKRPNFMSEESTNYEVLKRAVFVGSDEVLNTILEHTPSDVDTLVRALEFGNWRVNSRNTWPIMFLDKSNDSSERIRLLASHFAPLSSRARGELTLQACAVGDVSLLEELCQTETLFTHPIDLPPGRRPSYMHFAIRAGSPKALRFLLGRGVVRNDRLSTAMESPYQALSYNQIECFQELHDRFRMVKDQLYFLYLAMAEGAERLMPSYLAQYSTQILGDSSPSSNPQKTKRTPLAHYALDCAIHRLRPETVRYILGLGVHPHPWPWPSGEDTSLRSYLMPGVGDPFAIRWPYFNMNRAAFQRTQEILDDFGLPKLRVIV